MKSKHLIFKLFAILLLFCQSANAQIENKTSSLPSHPRILLPEGAKENSTITMKKLEEWPGINLTNNNR
jgi:hypothetical protein